MSFSKARLNPHSPPLSSPTPSLLVRLKSQCKELDFQLADLETENNTLQDENSALKSSLRRQDEQIIVLEETNAELSLDLKRMTTAKTSLQQQHEDVLAAVVAQRWGPVEPECNCRTERDRVNELECLEAPLLSHPCHRHGPVR